MIPSSVWKEGRKEKGREGRGEGKKKGRGRKDRRKGEKERGREEDMECLDGCIHRRIYRLYAYKDG